MIVDLLRNDLGRVCAYHSVRVTEAKVLECHPTVQHLVATIRGRLRDRAGEADLLRATFPGGSITGAPKIRAMEIIDEIEPTDRNVYTGCIGCSCIGGQSEWNIAIRTIVHTGDFATFGVGGGIVADSDPLGELEETRDKARGLWKALSQACHGPMGSQERRI
jgi:para-aminobenzoate synthetase component 1